MCAHRKRIKVFTDELDTRQAKRKPPRDAWNVAWTKLWAILHTSLLNLNETIGPSYNVALCGSLQKYGTTRSQM